MLFFTVLLIEILACAEVDIFVPSFPQLQELFHLTPFDVELTMSINLVAYCLTALMVGMMGDKYGRKPLILIGLVIFIAGSMICIFAPSFWMLLIGRALQGMGMAGPATLGYVVIADHFSVAEQQKKLGTLNGAVSLSMAVAPIVGSYIALYFNWTGNFVALFILACLAYALAQFFIPRSFGNTSLNLSLLQYVPVLKSKEVMLFLAVVNCVVLPFWIFIGISPILYMEDLGVSLDQFGWYQGAMAASFACVSFSSPQLLKYFGQKKCFYASYVLLILFLIACILLIVFNVKNPLIITGCMMIMSVSIIMPVNILWPIALEIMPEAKGRVSGIFVAFRMILTSIGLQGVSFFYSGTITSIALCLIFMGVLSLLYTYQLLRLKPLFKDI